METKIDGKLNLTRVLFDIYPPKQLKEIWLKDANRTEFAYINTKRGATTDMRNNNRPMPAFWSRLKVIDGSLMLTGIQRKDNGIKMTSKAELTDMTTKKATIQILVNSPGSCYLICGIFDFSELFQSRHPCKEDNPPSPTQSGRLDDFQIRIQSLVCLLLQATPSNSESFSLALFVRPERCPGRIRRGPAKLILSLDLHQSSLTA